MLYIVLILIIVPCVVLAVLSGLAKRPSDLGVRDGRLAACPESPNCVMSQASDRRHQVPPITFTDTAADAMERLRRVLRDRPRTTIVVDTDTYLHAECRSAVFRFVDDLEFTSDAAEGVIHVRSASRVGRWDFGANRRRVEEIRTPFELTGQSAVAANAERG